MQHRSVNYASLDDIQVQILDADLLLWPRRGLISSAGRGAYSHAAKAAWWGNDLFCLEVREWRGGRAVTLESQVQRYPGRIDVYRSNPGNLWPDYRREAATCAMRRLAASTATRTSFALRCCICRWCGCWSLRSARMTPPTAGRRSAAKPARTPTALVARSIPCATWPIA